MHDRVQGFSECQLTGTGLRRIIATCISHWRDMPHSWKTNCQWTWRCCFNMWLYIYICDNMWLYVIIWLDPLSTPSVLNPADLLYFTLLANNAGQSSIINNRHGPPVVFLDACRLWSTPSFPAADPTIQGCTAWIHVSSIKVQAAGRLLCCAYGCDVFLINQPGWRVNRPHVMQ